MNLKPFQKLVDLIKQSKTGYITKQELLEYDYSCSSPSSSSGDDADDNNRSYDFENNFDKIIGWGRMALLIDYNSDTETIRLRNDDVVSPIIRNTLYVSFNLYLYLKYRYAPYIGRQLWTFMNSFIYKFWFVI